MLVSSKNIMKRRREIDAQRKRRLLKAQKTGRNPMIGYNNKVIRVAKPGSEAAARIILKQRIAGGSNCSTVSQILHNEIWKGRRCFIIGGGPSLNNWDDFNRKYGDELIIGINRAYEKTDPTIIFSMDGRFWTWIENDTFGKEMKDRFVNYKKGFKLWMNATNIIYPEDIYTVNCVGKDKWGNSLATGLGGGQNSGYCALNLACILGADPIYLLGYDMRGDSQTGKQDWWHDGYPKVQPGSIYKNSFLPHFQRIPSLITNRVINLNPESALRCFEFGELKDVKPIKKPMVISYYTVNTGYEVEAQALRQSIKQYGLDREIVGVESLGGWSANTRYKAQFIKHMMERHPGRSLLFVDADAELLRYPELFDNLEESDVDFAAYMRDWSHKGRVPPKELLSGTLYFAPTNNARQLVNKWIKINESRQDRFEQKNLQEALESWRGEFMELPPEYCCIFDTMARMVADPVIEHKQASRRLRAAVGA